MDELNKKDKQFLTILIVWTVVTRTWRIAITELPHLLLCKGGVLASSLIKVEIPVIANDHLDSTPRL
jgi:hypothetical protein